jgi:hypothetical protein
MGRLDARLKYLYCEDDGCTYVPVRHVYDVECGGAGGGCNVCACFPCVCIRQILHPDATDRRALESARALFSCQQSEMT